MATIFCTPQAFTMSAGSQQATATISNAGTDHPAQVWRSNGLAGVFATLQTAGKTIDTLALMGTNIRSTDTVRFRGSNSADMSALLFDTTVQGWTGAAPARGATTLLAMANSYAPAFVRIDISSSGNPDGYVEVQRIVIGKRVQTDGINIGCDHMFEDSSINEEINGYTVSDALRMRDSWKVTMNNIKETDYWTTWYSFLRGVGSTAGFLFVPDTDPTLMQNQTILARVSSSAKGNYQSGELIAIDLNLKQV